MNPTKRTVSNLQIIAELCLINELQSRIIRKQADVLEQHGAAVMEDERLEAKKRLSRLLGDDEIPDELTAKHMSNHGVQLQNLN